MTTKVTEEIGFPKEQSMYWKLAALAVGTLIAILCVIPIKTHAVKMDVGPGGQLPPPRPSLWQMIGNMYLTPGTLALVLIIAAIAALLAFRIVRAA
jgi:hypothetical protein